MTTLNSTIARVALICPPTFLSLPALNRICEDLNKRLGLIVLRTQPTASRQCYGSSAVAALWHLLNRLLPVMLRAQSSIAMQFGRSPVLQTPYSLSKKFNSRMMRASDARPERMRQAMHCYLPDVIIQLDGSMPLDPEMVRNARLGALGIVQGELTTMMPNDNHTQKELVLGIFHQQDGRPSTIKSYRLPISPELSIAEVEGFALLYGAGLILDALATADPLSDAEQARLSPSPVLGQGRWSDGRQVIRVQALARWLTLAL